MSSKSSRKGWKNEKKTERGDIRGDTGQTAPGTDGDGKAPVLEVGQVPRALKEAS